MARAYDSCEMDWKIPIEPGVQLRGLCRRKSVLISVIPVYTIIIDDKHADDGKPEPPARVLIPREEDLQSANYLAKSRHGFPSFSLIWRQRFGQQEKDV